MQLIEIIANFNRVIYRLAMSLNYKHKLFPIAKQLSIELRRNSTSAEKILWQELKARKIFKAKFLRQHPLFYDITGKESFFIADFYCHEKRLVIELDGKYHDYQLTKDHLRTDILYTLGIRVIRFTNEEILTSLDTVLKHIQMELA